MGVGVVEDAEYLSSWINRAAKEVYESTDLPGSLREQVFKVWPNKQISLPQYVGELRAIREFYYYDKIELNDMRPRYNYNPWPQIWRRWRLKNPKPIMTDIENVSPLTITIPIAEPLVIVSIVGQTDNSNRIQENITMDAVSKTTTNSFIDIISITKNIPSTNNISIVDIDNIEISNIANNILAVTYLIADVSELPFVGESPYGEKFVEVLYKERLGLLINDSDEFPCVGFDDVIVYKALELWTSQQQGNELRAAAYFQKAAQVMAARIEHVEGPIQKEMTFGPSGYIGMFPRHRVKFIYPR